MRAWRHVSAALLLLAATARADDQPPPTLSAIRIDNHQETSAEPGAVITLRGRDLHTCPPLPEPQPGKPSRNKCRHEEVSVRLGDLDLTPLLLEALFDRVTVIVPTDAPLGAHELVLTIHGRGDARLALRIIAPLRRVRGRGCVVAGLSVRVLEQVRACADDLATLVRELDAWRGRDVVARLWLPFGGAPPAFDEGAYERWVSTRVMQELGRLRCAALVAEERIFAPSFERLLEMVAGWSRALAREQRVDAAARARYDEDRRALLRRVGLDD